MTLPPPLTPGDLLAAYAIVHVRAHTAPYLQGLAQRLLDAARQDTPEAESTPKEEP